MKALVKYVDFHPDNHQGGSGKSFEFTTMVNLPFDSEVKDIFRLINEHITKEAYRPFVTHECRFVIQKVEIFE